MNLAWTELYRLIGGLFSRFEMELVDTTVEDMKTEYYSTVSVSSLASKGVQVRVTKVLEAGKNRPM